MLRDVQGNCFQDEILGMGTLTQLIIHPREVFHYPLHHRAASLVLTHDTLAETSSPSVADIELTKLLLPLLAASSVFLLMATLSSDSSGYTSLSNEGIVTSNGYAF